jgi:hypothetical protein
MGQRNEVIVALDDLLKKGEQVWVRLYGGVLICLVEKVSEVEYRGKYTPCVNNSRSYSIPARDIKEIKVR